ncbi:MAG: L,D-transpeptidase family protein [Pseudomonadota bacterium]
MKTAAAQSPAIAAGYAQVAYQPIWLSDGESGGASPAAMAFLATLSEADRHALPTERYGRADLAARLSNAAQFGLSERVRLELDITRSFLAYAHDITGGVLEPSKVDRELYVYPERLSPLELIGGLTRAADPAMWLETLAPTNAAYARLVERYRSFRQRAETGGWGEPLTGRQTLRPGQRSGDVAVLRDRLTKMGYYDGGFAAADNGVVLATNETVTDAQPAPLGDPLRYDDALVDAVRLFQERHGLNQDGAVGPATRAALNVDPGFRAAQIAVNLERMRWLNKDLGAKHIMVNLASFDMAVIENGRTAFESRVVVGKAKEHRTPEFSDEMEHMVVNPTWYVPYSIASKEILPKLKRDPGYLARKNMRLHGADPWSVDWSQVTQRTFPGRVTQGPGKNNALGRVKFMFPNDHAIYLHDTPAKSLFNRDTRAYSHGCVRVHRPYEFAEYLLSAQEDDPKGTFERLLRRGKERYVNFDEPVPVHLTYRTAWVDDNGHDQFRGDIYGRDRKVLAALEKAGVKLPAH